MDQTPAQSNDLSSRVEGLVEGFILKSRYLLVPFLAALLFVILKIAIDFYKVLIGTIHASNLNGHTIQALELLDITMIANLIWLICAGSYYVFVDNHYPGTSGQKRPRCLIHVSAGILKEKMASSLIGVSSVHLLQIFLELSEAGKRTDWPQIGALIAIHIVFIIGLLAFNYANSADHHNHEREENAHPPAA